MQSDADKIEAARQDAVHVLGYLQALERAHPGRVGQGLLAFLAAANACPFNAEVLAQAVAKAAPR